MGDAELGKKQQQTQKSRKFYKLYIKILIFAWKKILLSRKLTEVMFSYVCFILIFKFVYCMILKVLVEMVTVSCK